jgi:hypothetical protein
VEVNRYPKPEATNTSGLRYVGGILGNYMQALSRGERGKRGDDAMNSIMFERTWLLLRLSPNIFSEEWKCPFDFRSDSAPWRRTSDRADDDAAGNLLCNRGPGPGSLSLFRWHGMYVRMYVLCCMKSADVRGGVGGIEKSDGGSTVEGVLFFSL